MNNRTALLVLISLGAFVSLLLLFRSQALNANITTATDYCDLVFGITCDTALTDNASWQIYFPVNSMALIFFGVVGILLIIEKPILDQLAFVSLSAGLGISIYQIYHLASNSIACPLCYVNYVIILISFLLTGGLLSDKSLLTRKLVKGSILLLFLAIAAEGYIIGNGIGSKVKVALKHSLENYNSSPTYKIPKRMTSYISCVNPSNLNLVVFNSYECSACQLLDQNLDKLKETYGESLCIEYRNFPLSSQCNPSVGSDMQAYSCFAAKASIAAGMQGKFDVIHHAIFNSSQNIDSTQIVNLALSSGLDMEKWVSDLNSPSVNKILSDDINVANEIGISATPTLLLNGKKVDNNPAFIIYMIEHLLQGK